MLDLNTGEILCNNKLVIQSAQGDDQMKITELQQILSEVLFKTGDCELVLQQRVTLFTLIAMISYVMIMQYTLMELSAHPAL